MKKIACILLAVVMFVMIFTIPTYASAENASQWKYYDKLCQYFKDNRIGPEPNGYAELYYYYADEFSQEPEWTLIKCIDDLNFISRDTVAIEDIFMFSTGEISNFSDTRYGVYVTALDTFLRVDSRDIELILEHCPGFVEKMKEKKFFVSRGDINDDFGVNIIDATYIQRYVAGYEDTVSVRESVHKTYRDDISVKYIVHSQISDFDHDGETTIFDATAIQMKLAKIESE